MVIIRAADQNKEKTTDRSVCAFGVVVVVLVDGKNWPVGRGQEAIIRLLKQQLLEEVRMEIWMVE